MKSHRSPLHHEALTVEDLVVGQIIACVRFINGQPADLIRDETNYRLLHVLEINVDDVLVEPFVRRGGSAKLDLQYYGLEHLEPHVWSTAWCTMTRASMDEIRATQRAAYQHRVSRGPAAKLNHQLIKL